MIPAGIQRSRLPLRPRGGNLLLLLLPLPQLRRHPRLRRWRQSRLLLRRRMPLRRNPKRLRLVRPGIRLSPFSDSLRRSRISAARRSTTTPISRSRLSAAKSQTSSKSPDGCQGRPPREAPKRRLLCSDHLLAHLSVSATWLESSPFSDSSAAPRMLRRSPLRPQPQPLTLQLPPAIRAAQRQATPAVPPLPAMDRQQAVRRPAMARRPVVL